MKSSELKPGDRVIFDNGQEVRTIEVTKQLIDKYEGEMPSEYKAIKVIQEIQKEVGVEISKTNKEKNI